MKHTGYLDLPRVTTAPQGSLDEALRTIDATAELGIVYNLPAIDKARAHLAKAAAVNTARRAHIEGAPERIAQAARDYAANTIDAEALVRAAAAEAATLTTEGKAGLMRHLNAAAQAVEREGMAELRKVTEAQWLKPLRPAITEALATVNRTADELGILTPRPQTVGVVRVAHPWAPDRQTLAKHTPTRHAWERLDDALADLDALHAVADYLRQLGLLPTVDGRTIREDYRWLHVDRLNGDPRQPREFYLSNREHAEPGIFTAAEMIQADTPPAPEPEPEAEPVDADEPVSV